MSIFTHSTSLNACISLSISALENRRYGIGIHSLPIRLQTMTSSAAHRQLAVDMAVDMVVYTPSYPQLHTGNTAAATLPSAQ